MSEDNVRNAVDIKLKKNDAGKLILFITFLKENFTLQDKDLCESIVEKYSKVVNQYTDLYIITDTRNVNTISHELAWKLINNLVRCNDAAKKNVKRSSILMNSKELIRVVKMLEKVYSYVVPTKIVSTNEEALAFINE